MKIIIFIVWIVFFMKKLIMKNFFDDLQTKTLDYWKNKNIVNPSKLNQLACKVKTLNLVELKTIKKIINNNKMIKKLKLMKFLIIVAL